MQIIHMSGEIQDENR